jgi:hypothetical protein
LAHYRRRPLKSPLIHSDILELERVHLNADEWPVRAVVWDVREMGSSDLQSEDAAPVGSAMRLRSRAIGLLVDEEFDHLRDTTTFLADDLDFDGSLDRCEGLQIGLAMAGVDATIVPIRPGRFLEWVRLMRRPLVERALDEFAALALALRSASVTAVMADVAYSGRIAAFSVYGESRRWLRHRRAFHTKLEANSGRVETLPIRVEAFIDWCACLRQDTSEAALDRYALLELERLTTFD